MASATPAQTPNAAPNLQKNELYQIAPDFWNVRASFKTFKIIDIGTHMSMIKLRNGKFLVIDTIELTDHV